MPARKKLSTTIDARSYAFLHLLVESGQADSVGEAVDKAVRLARRLESRAALDRETARYFSRLSKPAAAEEAALEEALSAVTRELDFDQP